MAKLRDLRGNSIRWLVASAGELQEQIRELKAANSKLHAENVALKRQLGRKESQKALAAKV